MTLTGTNTYLVGGDTLAVIDPGPDMPEHLDAIVAAVEARGMLAVSLVTHHHDDHLPAARRLRERLGVPIAGHADLPGVDRPLRHEELIALPGATLRTIETPGHTDDHVCFFLEEERALFSGDLIAGTGTVVVGAGRPDLARYLASLELVGTLVPRVILPGHGPIVSDAAAKVREYTAHRLGRECQVLAELAGGGRTVEQLVATIYADVRPDLHPAAARNVRSHLWKLEAEGRAVEQDGVWALRAGAAR
jgi:glyoxylase-like metal-dependent hydrolase (beta-lactamase superfamily II)